MAESTRRPSSSGPVSRRVDSTGPAFYSSLHPPDFLGEAAGLVDLPSRRAVLRTSAELALTGVTLKGHAAIARAEKSPGSGLNSLPQINSMLRAATTTEQVPGVVALAASDHGVEYEGVFGERRLRDQP